jgi:lipid II:glycine glycyltransferase (peptidoglycan interpeptide bridge formation enzyme)
MSNTFQKEKEAALNKILMLEKQLDEKQKLELDIEQLRGKLEVVKHMEGEGVDVKKRTEELTKELNERIEAMDNLKELNQVLINKQRMANDEVQDAKKELIRALELIQVTVLVFSRASSAQLYFTSRDMSMCECVTSLYKSS